MVTILSIYGERERGRERKKVAIRKFTQPVRATNFHDGNTKTHIWLWWWGGGAVKNGFIRPPCGAFKWPVRQSWWDYKLA